MESAWFTDARYKNFNEAHFTGLALEVPAAEPRSTSVERVSDLNDALRREPTTKSVVKPFTGNYYGFTRVSVMSTAVICEVLRHSIVCQSR